jgi:hypothetical protein
MNNKNQSSITLSQKSFQEEFIEVTPNFNYSKMCLESIPCKHYIMLNGTRDIWNGESIYTWLVNNNQPVPIHFQSYADDDVFIEVTPNFKYSKECLESDPCCHSIILNGTRYEWDGVDIYEWCVSNNQPVPIHFQSYAEYEGSSSKF